MRLVAMVIRSGKKGGIMMKTLAKFYSAGGQLSSAT